MEVRAFRKAKNTWERGNSVIFGCKVKKVMRVSVFFLRFLVYRIVGVTSTDALLRVKTNHCSHDKLCTLGR